MKKTMGVVSWAVMAAVLSAGMAVADVWPGLNGGGAAANSCPTAIGTNLNLRWMIRLDPQRLNAANHIGSRFPYAGSIRSKNIVIRNGEVALLAQGVSSADLAFYDATLGGVRRSFSSTLTQTTKAEWTPVGVEGRDLRNGQFLLYWHANGNIYCRSSGDTMQIAVLRAADGVLQLAVGRFGANGSGYLMMADNSIWNVASKGGHQGQGTWFELQDNGGSLAAKSFGSSGGILHNIFTWCGPVLMDGDWIYTLGAATHPDLGWSNFDAPEGMGTQRRQWLGARVHGFKLLGQTATAGNQNFVNGSAGSFTWVRTNVFVATDHDLASAVKPWCLGASNIFVVTESASWTTNDAKVDFSQPMVLNALNRTNGAVAFSLPLGITGAGCGMSKNFGYYGGGTSWRPQVAYANRTAVDGREYVSVLLPEAVETYGWLSPQINPTNSATNLNTRIALVDATAGTELWTYQYPRGGTTPVLAQCVNTSTKQIIAGDALYVAYVKTAEPLDNYISTNILSALTLYVDRFTLTNGTKTSFQFPLGVQANTMQLDDLAAADGMLYALVTTREWDIGSPDAGGAQALIALGSVTGGNQSPAFTAGLAASPAAITAPVLSLTLSAQATDPDGPAPTLAWSPVTGPATVRFSTNNVAAATNVIATFQQSGTYVIECRASDGELSVTSNVTVTVNQPLTTVNASVPDNAASEPGANTGTFTLSRSGGDTNIPLTVYYTLGGTASIGVDYALLPTGSVTLAAGVTSTNIVVTPIDDELVEPPETVTLRLAIDPALNYKPGTTSAFTMTIADNDVFIYTVVIGAYSNTTTEGATNISTGLGRMEIRRDGTISPLPVFYTLSGTASNGVDYASLTGSVTIAESASNAVFDLRVLADAIYDPNETLILTLASGTNYTVGTPNTATVTIIDVSPMRVVWNRDQADASWAANYWTDVVSQGNGTNLPRQCDHAWVGDVTIDARSNGANMAAVTVADLNVGWRLDAGNADNGNLRVLNDGIKQTLAVTGHLRLADGSNCSGRVVQNGGRVTASAGIRLACGDGYGPWSYELNGGELRVLAGGVLIGDLGPGGLDFDNESASPGTLALLNGSRLSCDYGGSYRVNSGAAGVPARTNIVATNGLLEIPGDMQIGGSYVLTSEGSVYVWGNLELGKSATRSNTIINVQGGYFAVDLLDMDEPGAAQFNISGGTVMAGALQIGSNVNNRIRISHTGVLQVLVDNGEGLTYSAEAAQAEIAAGRITADRTLDVTDDGSYVVISLPPVPLISVVATDGSASENPLEAGTFTIQRAIATSSVVAVSYTLGGTATYGADYTMLSTGSVTLAAGVTSTNIVVTSLDDSDIEEDETVTLTLLGDSAYDLGTPTSATVVIGSEDGSVGDVSVTASDSAAAETPADSGQFTIARTNTTGAINVGYAMSGTASNGVDYTALSSSVRLEEGQSSAVVTVTPLDDGLIEDPETVILTLLPGSRYTPGISSIATVTLVSEDIPTVTLVAGADAVETSGVQGSFICTRAGSGPGLTSTALTVFYTVAGTASNGVDYTSLPGSVVISNGQTTATIKIAPVADGVEEGSESVLLSLASAGPYTVGVPSSGTIAILDRLPFYAVRNGRFNASNVDTWGQGLGIYPSSAGDKATITNYTVTAINNVWETASGVTVDIGTGGTLLLGTQTNPIEALHPNSAVTINAGGTLRVEGNNTVSNAITLNGGRIHLASGTEVSTRILGSLTVAQASVLELATRSKFAPYAVYGSGKLTVNSAVTVEGRTEFGMGAGSTWTGDLELSYTGQVRNVAGFQLAKTIPGNLRLGPGAAFWTYNAGTSGWSGLPGVVSGSGTLASRQTTQWDVGATGNVSPGDTGVGQLKVTADPYQSGGDFNATVRFLSGATYSAEVLGDGGSLYTNDSLVVYGDGAGTGIVTIASGTTCNITLWTPTNNVSLDATIIDTRTGTGGEGTLTGSFSTVSWSNAAGWTGLVVTNIGNDLRVQGNYTAVINPDADSNGISDEWETRYFGSTTNAEGVAGADWDKDGLSNSGEWMAGTDPTNSTSAFRFTNVVQNVGVGMVLRWPSESNRYYTLRLSTNLQSDPFITVLTNRMPANPPMNVHTDAVSRPGAFYQVIVTNQ